MSNEVDISVTQGTTCEYTYTITDANGDPLDTTGASVSGAISDAKTSSAVKLVDLSAYLTIPSNSVVKLLIPPANTVSIVADHGDKKCLPYDIKLTLSGGATVQIAQGDALFTFSPDDAS